MDLETCVICVERSLVNVSSQERGAEWVLLRHRGEGQGCLAPRRHWVLQMRGKGVQFGGYRTAHPRFLDSVCVPTSTHSLRTSEPFWLNSLSARTRSCVPGLVDSSWSPLQGSLLPPCHQSPEGAISLSSHLGHKLSHQGLRSLACLLCLERGQGSVTQGRQNLWEVI